MNYLAVMTTTEAAESVRTFLDHPESIDGEVVELAGPPGSVIFVNAREAEKTTSTRKDLFFRGTAIHRDRGLLLFGLPGLLDSRASGLGSMDEADGEFILVETTDSGIRISRDIFGHVRLLWTEIGPSVAVSDSLLALVEFRKHCGVVPKINEEVALARTVPSALAGQQMSRQTIVENIFFAPAGRGLDIRLQPEGVSASLTGVPMAGLLAGDVTEGGYVDGVRRGAAATAGLLLACAEVPGWNSSLSISGGYDSRAVFAAAERLNLQRCLRLDTMSKTKEHARDFEVATGLARQFGFALNAQPAEWSPSIAEDKRDDSPLQLWGASLLGVYDGMGPPISWRRAANKFEFSGIGAELLKGNWDWKSWSEVVHTMGLPDGPVRAAFDAQGRQGIEEVGADPSALGVSEAWYAAYRNGIHGAAGHVSLHLTGLLPLQQLELARLGHRVNRSRPRAARVSRLRRRTIAADQTAIADISMVLSAQVALYPYDDPARNLRRSYVSSRLRWLGGPLNDSEIQPWTVFGHPKEDSGGTSSLALALSKGKGYGISTDDPREVLRATQERVSAIKPTAVRLAYQSVQDNAEWRILHKNRPLWFSGGSIAKVLALGIFD